jgi:hypothetical protein
MSFKQAQQYNTVSDKSVTADEVAVYYELMVDHFGVENFTHKCSGRSYKRSRGSCRTKRNRTTGEILSRRILIHEGGMNVAVVVHEFAHIVAGHENGHNSVFSAKQEELLTMAEGLLY